jgi:hypothetical protein
VSEREFSAYSRIERKGYSIEGSGMDGESGAIINFQFPQPDLFISVRFTPKASRQLASDIVRMTEASEQFIQRQSVKKGKPCPKCHQPFDARGLNAHQKVCKGKP